MFKKLFERKTHLFLMALALAGFAGMVSLILSSRREPPPSRPLVLPASSPFADFIAAEGLLEARAENLRVGCPVGGVVERVWVGVGAVVGPGVPLFTLDTRQAKAERALRQRQLEEARAALKTAEAVAKASRTKFQIAQRIQDKRAISTDEYEARRHAALMDQAAWEKAAKALAVAQAQLQCAQTNLDLLTVKAPPLETRVLQVNIHAGEYAGSPSSAPPILLGASGPLQLRVDIDENEAWRYQPGSRAVAFLRGNPKMRLPLRFVRVEPYVVPKVSLTGSSSERVDIRVLQVIYALQRSSAPLYAGQQADVFIEVTGGQGG